MKTICIIPARGGSKGLPKKNVQPVNGKPLIAHTILHAKESCVDEVYVSTDDNTIAQVSEQYGARVIQRPGDLSTDTSTTEQALTHALNVVEQTQPVDVVVFLSCTQPYRDISWINTCVEKVKYDGYESACVGYMTTKNYWRKISNDYSKLWWREYTNRQQRECIYQENTGAACATKASLIRDGKRIGNNVYIVEVDKHNIDIHEQIDINIAELFIR